MKIHSLHDIMRKRIHHRAGLGLILFALIFIGSYKILEPGKSWRTWKRMVHEDSEQFLDRSEMDDEDSSGEEDDKPAVADIIKNLTNKYKLDLEYPLEESPWTIAANWVTLRNIFPEESPELGAILNAMATRKITLADVCTKGTQLKMSFTLEGGQQAMFKPKRDERTAIYSATPYAGADRHNGEIAAFHLGRLLEFRRIPLVVGRVVDMETEIRPVASKELSDTFYTKKGGRSCFYGQCHYCKDRNTGVCGVGTKLEGAVILWLPQTEKPSIWHPWRRTYNNESAAWEKDPEFCRNTILVNDSRFSSGPGLMDIMDGAILDYLMGNADRHSYETLTSDETAMMLLLDNAKSFGNPYLDEKSILAPLFQCCRLRETTWSRLLILQDGVLSAVMEALLAQDPIAPIITQLHIHALDRRLRIILSTVQTCIDRFGEDVVIVHDR